MLIPMPGHLPSKIFLILLMLVCTNTFGQGKKNDPRIRISDRVIERGDTVRVSWEILKAKKVELEGLPEALPLSGHFTFKPQEDTLLTFIFSLTRRKEIIRRQRIKVYVPEVIRFTLPDSATDEEETELYWNTENAVLEWEVWGGDSVSLVGMENRLARKGSVQVSPDKTTKYTLKVYDGTREIASNHTLTIT